MTVLSSGWPSPEVLSRSPIRAEPALDVYSVGLVLAFVYHWIENSDAVKEAFMNKGKNSGSKSAARSLELSLRGCFIYVLFESILYGVKVRC